MRWRSCVGKEGELIKDVFLDWLLFGDRMYYFIIGFKELYDMCFRIVCLGGVFIYWLLFLLVRGLFSEVGVYFFLFSGCVCLSRAGIFNFIFFLVKKF